MTASGAIKLLPAAEFRQPVSNRCPAALSKAADVRYAFFNAAASAGAEGKHCLSVQIIGFKERINCHRRCMPPYRVAQQDHIVVFHMFYAGGQLRPGVLIQFPAGPVNGALVA